MFDPVRPYSNSELSSFANMSSSKSAAVQANVLWQKQPKANAELFALTYGALMRELLNDLEKPELIVAELDRIGHSMGMRCMEEFLAKANETTNNFEETPELLKMALRMFFGIAADSRWKQDETSDTTCYGVFFSENPLTLFVELPEDHMNGEEEGKPLEYNQLLAGWCRGVLELLQMECKVVIAQSVLNGDSVNEIRIQLQQVLQEGAGEDYQEE